MFKSITLHNQQQSRALSAKFNILVSMFCRMPNMIIVMPRGNWQYFPLAFF